MTTPPDILWIVTTQWRAQSCGYAGDVNARTPALDAFAADPATTHYAQAVTPHPFGPFARAALLTGQTSPANGLSNYLDAFPRGKRTIAHDLGERGYATAFFGKWGVGERDPVAPLVGELAARIPVPPGARGGFARWTGFEGGFLLNDPWLHGDGLEPGVEFARVDGYQSDVLAGLAGEWLERPADSPRFTVVSLEAPHPPYAAEAPVGITRIQPEEVVLSAKVPRGGEVEAKARRELAGYYAHIAATDAAIGRLLARVPRETVVVFTSVHGDMHGAHGLFRKGWPHEESVRVPLLVRWELEAGSGERGADGGRRSDEAVSLVDLPAMALAWSEGRAWRCPRDRVEISMPSVVGLPHQCDRVWSGWRSATEKRVFNADGTEWVLGE
ncbi:MAG: sulfatase-like hydrolase/transferase [Burkholderiales bacterium]|nr:sulfatase-like hydrolase/transferase [Opitutaceae bacterium]